jgi:hypothetical protein
MENLTENQKARILNIGYVVGSISFLGSVGGLMYANRTGGKFWRYVGYFIVGGMVLGVPAKIISLPFINKIVGETKDDEIPAETKEEEQKPLVEVLQEEIDSKNNAK